jgi:hypothetical protein
MATKELGVFPDNGVKAFIGVEGTNDISYLRNISSILSNTESDIANLVDAEDDGRIIFIPLGGSNLASWVGRLKKLERPEFHLYDRDSEPPAPPKYENTENQINARDGCLAIHTDGRELENYIHPDAIREQWPDANYLGHVAFTDVPRTLAQCIVTADGKEWGALSAKARERAERGVKIKLNSDVVNRMTPAQLTEMDPNGVIRGFLRQVGKALAAE